MSNYHEKQPRVVEYGSGYLERVRYGTYEATQQTFVAGRFIYIFDGRVYASGPNDPIVGIALRDASNAATVAATNEIPYIQLLPEDILAMRIASAAGEEYEVTELAPGQMYGFHVINNICYINSMSGRPALRYIEPILVGNTDPRRSMIARVALAPGAFVSYTP